MMHGDLLDVHSDDAFDQSISALFDAFATEEVSTDDFDLDEYLNDVHFLEESPISIADCCDKQTKPTNDTTMLLTDSILNNETTKEDRCSEKIVEPTSKRTHHYITTSKCLFEDYPDTTHNSDVFFVNRETTAYLLGKVTDAFIKQNCKEAQDNSGTKVSLHQCEDKTLVRRRWGAKIKRAVSERRSSKLRKIRVQPNRCYHLWDFLKDILSKRIYPSSKCVEWVDNEKHEFRIANTREMASLWGECKRSTTMTYDKLSRAIRYYCSLDILQKIEGKRLHFKFGKGKMWTRL